MELFGALLGLSVAWQAVAWALVSVLFPLFWLWMLIDAILRDPSEYPSGTSNAKLLWVLALVFVNVTAPFYLFFVFGKRKRSPYTSVQSSAPAAPCAS